LGQVDRGRREVVEFESVSIVRPSTPFRSMLMLLVIVGVATPSVPPVGCVSKLTLPITFTCSVALRLM
jgi:hypothetical protein